MKSRLQLAIKILEIDLDLITVDLLLHYLDLLILWNKTHNLCAPANMETMLYYHVVDSLTLLKTIPNVAANLLDVGSGAGLPGIPLALSLPIASVSMVEARRKKTVFVQHVIQTLAIRNAAVINSRVEELDKKYDIIVSRAMAKVTTFLPLVAKIHNQNTRILLMKSHLEGLCLNDVVEGWSLQKITDIKVPGISHDRLILEFGRL